MAKKHLKNLSTSLAIRDMKMKTSFEAVRVGKVGLSFLDFLIRIPLHTPCDCYEVVHIIMLYLMLL